MYAPLLPAFARHLGLKDSHIVSDGTLTSATVTVTLDVSLDPFKFFFPLIGR